MSRYRISTVLLAVLLAGANTSHAWAEPTVEVVDLGTLGGARSAAVDINEAGVSIGWAETADGTRHAVRWDRNGTVTDLGTVGGASSEAIAVNDRGEVAGTIVTQDGNRHAARWDASGIGVDLGMQPGADESWAIGISDDGAVAGNEVGSWGFGTNIIRWDRSGRLTDFTPDRSAEAFAVNGRGTVAGVTTLDDGRRQVVARWDARGTMTVLDEIPGAYAPLRINDANVVAGQSNWYYHAVRWDQQGRVTDLGILPGGLYSAATAIGADGTVVGFATVREGLGPSHAVRWDRQGQISDLGTLPGDTDSAASAINCAGTIVGKSSSAAVAWDTQGRITELPGIGDGKSAEAVAINDEGLAVGYSYMHVIEYGHALLWRLPG
jgi:probable HAF family extracellular repeat protein